MAGPNGDRLAIRHGNHDVRGEALGAARTAVRGGRRTYSGGDASCRPWAKSIAKGFLDNRGPGAAAQAQQTLQRAVSMSAPRCLATLPRAQGFPVSAREEKTESAGSR